MSACIGLALPAGCGRPNTQALKKLACEHVASTIDLQSVGQIEALRRALGLPPGVDPIGTCRSLGVTMEPKPQGKNAGETGRSENGENRKSESNGGEN